MKMIKKYASILMMLTLLVGFTSCEDDEDFEELLIGVTWGGDFGGTAVVDGYDYPLYSEITFSARHRGIENQRFENGERFQSLDFDWDWDGPDLRLTYYDVYGHYLSTLYLCDIDIYRGVLTGTLLEEYGEFIMNVRLLAL